MLRNNAADDWKEFGDDNPYFGVLSDPKFSGQRLAEPLREEFFRSGEDHIRSLIEALEGLYGSFPRSSALDFGCGVGRITHALAKEFDEVVGLDVSPGMLVEARRNAQAGNLANVTYIDSLEPDCLKPSSHDFVHSYIVLQHIPVSIGEDIIKRLVAAVKPGGVGALHMTIAPARGRLKVAFRNFAKRNRLLRAIGNVTKGRPWNNPAMEMNLYRTERIIDFLAQSGIDRFNCIYVDDWGSVGLFFLFRRQEGEPKLSPWANPVTERV